MTRKCKNFNSISRYTLLLMMVAGGSAAAVGAEEVKNPQQLKFIEAAKVESQVRSQILADIDMQKKSIENMMDKKEYAEAKNACKALVSQLESIPGTEAKAKLTAMRAFYKSILRRWAAHVMDEAQDLYDAGKFTEAKDRCAIVTKMIFEDDEEGSRITAPFVEKCMKQIAAAEYRDGINIKKFDETYEKNIASIDRLMREAQTYYNNNKYQNVMDTLEKVYLIDPFNVRATTLLDKTYRKMYSMARARHRVTTQEMLAQEAWNWVMPVKTVKEEMKRENPEFKIAKNSVEARMEKIVFSKFDSPGMDIKEILKFLDQKSKAYDTEGIGVTIIPQFSAQELSAPQYQKIYMRFSNMPLKDILRYLCLNLKLKYKIDSYGNVLIGTSVDDIVATPYRFPVRNDLVVSILGDTASAAPAAVIDAPAEDIGAGAPAEDGGAGAPAAAAPSASELKMKAYFSARGIEFPTGSSIRYNQRQHCLEVINSEENLIKLDTLLRQINAIDLPMIMTEVKFVEVGETDFNQLGFDWNFSMTDANRTNGLWNFSTSTNFVPQEEQNERPSAFIQNLNLLPNFEEDFGGLKPSLNVTVHALSQNDKVEVLTSPRLISKNGVEASIKMVTETRYPESWEAPEIETESDNVTTISFPVPDLGEATPVGIMLKVTPSLNPDGTISLDLHPEIVTFLGSENSGYPVSVQQGVINRESGAMTPSILNKQFNIWMPELGIRRIDAKVRVIDGETIVLGGIISNTVERKEEKMPLLGSIPLLGRLFQNRSESSNKSNLLIFVTARLINTIDGRPVNQVEDNGTPHFNF